MAIPQTALNAAHCARAIATIARTRLPALNAPSRAALVQIAERLDAAALALETEDPGTLDGITITNTLPWDAYAALSHADDIAANNPTIGFPADLGRYVTAPIFGDDAPMPAPLQPRSAVLAGQAADLIARLHATHAHLKTATTPDVTTALLETAFTLHRKHARLAAAAAFDNARPCNQH
ncbi:hypothetical protein [Streptomyces similanensis]|uniref:Uncharacterized protein n=1 Tax=Streptomyces similanensis TaxID=1274988 RepID=A0ABP9L3Z8_9ACTN